MGSNKYQVFLRGALILLAALTVALTLYSCTRFYTFLPTSDTWIYTDFLAQAAQGKLLLAELFVKHNEAHRIALPKLVYFFDMWLTKGSGVLVVSVSLLAMLATTGIFLAVIFNIKTIDTHQKHTLSLLAIIFLLSICQVESLLNPANVQWSLLVFAATLTAWFAWQLVRCDNIRYAAGLVAGVILVSLTSASAGLIILPLMTLFAAFRFGRATAWRSSIFALFFGVLLLLIAETLRLMLWPERLPLLVFMASKVGSLDITAQTRADIIKLFNAEPVSAHLGWLLDWLQFCTNFIVPAVERLHSGALTIFAGFVVLAAMVMLARSAHKAPDHTGVFFGLLLLFTLVTVAITGLARSYSSTAFTFRFVNLGQLFGISLVILLYLQITNEKIQARVITPCVIVYVFLLSWISVMEANAFGYGRNHVRLNQVAYSLDIRDPFVVSAMPGTIWEKIDYETVQANKHKLRDEQAGIYSSAAWQTQGRSVYQLGLEQAACETTIVKQRRLLPDQPAYRLQGESRVTASGEKLTRVYFADSEGWIRGYGIPVLPSRNLHESYFLQSQWTGFANLEPSLQTQQLTVHPYNDRIICEGLAIDLPVYEAPRKKTTAPADTN